MPIILIVDDDSGVQKMLHYLLENEGYAILEAKNTEQAILLISEEMPDLILLDWMMPGLSGLDFMKRLRANKMTAHIPIIMLTAKDTEDDRVKGLLKGADDYVAKPFSPRELSARIKSLLRRTKPHITSEEVVFSHLKLQPDEHKLLIAGESVAIGMTEFCLLLFFVTHVGKIYSRSQIMDNVWGFNQYIQERTIDVHILRLRKILRPYGMGNLIETVRSLGYRFRMPQEKTNDE